MAFLLFCRTGFISLPYEVGRRAIRIKRPGCRKPGQTSTNFVCDLRRPGDHGRLRDGRPMALRHRLSPGLPLSDVVLRTYYSTKGLSCALQEIVMHFTGLKNRCLAKS